MCGAQFPLIVRKDTGGDISLPYMRWRKCALKSTFCCAAVMETTLPVPEYGKTTAELSPEEKNKISHRGKALEMIKEEL